MAKIDKTGRRPKRLTRLKINEVSAVSRGAGEGVRVVLMKRDGGKRYRFNDAGSLVPVDEDQADVGKSDRLAAVRQEIEQNRAFAASYAKSDLEDDMSDVIKAADDRIAAIQKAFPGISRESAMLKLASSRAPLDQKIWRDFKDGTALASSIGKDFNVEKAVKKMVARCDDIIATDCNVRSRQSALAKVASSPLEADQQLWARWKASGAVMTEEDEHPGPGVLDATENTEAWIAGLMRTYGVDRAQAEKYVRDVRSGAIPQVLTVQPKVLDHTQGYGRPPARLQ